MTLHQRLRALCHDASITALWLIAYGVLLIVFVELFKAAYFMYVMFPSEYLIAVPAAFFALVFIFYRAVCA